MLLLSVSQSKVYTPEMVALWTNHRVMEWLRTVDLSEYAPNLRGSGVHGALIVSISCLKMFTVFCLPLLKIDLIHTVSLLYSNLPITKHIEYA